MSEQASIDVQFKPFRLTLIRGNDGQWVASLYRLGDDLTSPLVVGYSSPDRPETGARVTLTSGAPRLAVGTAMFSLPTKQLQRVRDWIQKQSLDVMSVEQRQTRDESFGRSGPDGAPTP